MRLNRHLASSQTDDTETSDIQALLSHHPKELWEDKCYTLKFNNKKFGLCARCSGALLGIVLSFFIIIFVWKNTGAAYFVFFPAPAFFDWGAYNLRNIRFGKHSNFVTGMLMGMAVPVFYLNILSLNWLFVLSGLFYLLIFSLIYIMKLRRKS